MIIFLKPMFISLVQWGSKVWHQRSCILYLFMSLDIYLLKYFQPFHLLVSSISTVIILNLLEQSHCRVDTCSIEWVLSLRHLIVLFPSYWFGGKWKSTLWVGFSIQKKTHIHSRRAFILQNTGGMRNMLIQPLLNQRKHLLGVWQQNKNDFICVKVWVILWSARRNHKKNSLKIIISPDCITSELPECYCIMWTS